MAARYDAYGGYDQDQRRPPLPPQSYQGGPSQSPAGVNGGRNNWQAAPPQSQNGGPPYNGGYNNQYAPPQPPMPMPMPPPPSSSGPGPMRHQPAHPRAAPYARPPQPPSHHQPQQSQNQYVDHNRPPQFGNQQRQEGYEPRGPPAQPVSQPHQSYNPNPYPTPQPNQHNNNNRHQGPPPAHSPPPPEGYGYSHGPPRSGPDFNRGPGAPYQNDRSRRPSPPPQGRKGRQASPQENDQEAAKIEKRIAKERPCRILFIRNVKYNVDGGILKRKFAEMGEMKSFFDLISSRGLVFVTYHDLRTAISAREGLQGFEVQGRPIDIHYSLPRDEDNPKRKCDREKNQGTIRVVLKDNPAPIREQELERMFGGFGDIKGMYFSGGNPATERLVEFFDTRATCEAYDRMQNAPYPTGGKVELFFDWDVKDIPISHPSAGPRPSNRNAGDHRARESMPPPPTPLSASGSNYDRPPPGPPPQQYQPDARPPFAQDARPPYHQSNDRPPYPSNQPPADYRQGPPPQQMPPPPLPPNHFNGQPPTPASSIPPHPPTPRDPYDRPPYGNQAPPTPSYSPSNNAPSQPPNAAYPREVTPQYQPGANPNVPLGPPSGPPIPPPQGQAGSPPPPPANLSNLLASLGNLPQNGPSSAPAGSSNFHPSTQAPPFQAGRDRPYTPSDPYSRSGDPDRVANFSGPPPPNNYRPVPPGGPSAATPQHGGGPPLPPPGMLAMLGQRQGGSALSPAQSSPPRNGTPSLPMPPAPAYGQAQPEYTPSAPASSAPPVDQSNSQVNALLAMLSSQQQR